MSTAGCGAGWLESGLAHRLDRAADNLAVRAAISSGEYVLCDSFMARSLCDLT